MEEFRVCGCTETLCKRHEANKESHDFKFRGISETIRKLMALGIN